MGEFVMKFVFALNSRKDQLQKAAQAIKSVNLPIGKIKEEEVLKLDQKDNHLYVCDPFEGDAFDHLVKIGCRVVGVQCVLSCLKLVIPVPKVSQPLCNLSMRGARVSCSSIDKMERVKLHQLIEWMGGEVSKDLTANITHLIVGEVGSKKYHVAVSRKMPVMLSDWIYSSWESSKDNHFVATDQEVVEKYKCPSFKGCVISVTGINTQERPEIMKLVQENGGAYSGELKCKECTHLIVGVARGTKYEYAKKWKIHCVPPKWFYESIEAGVCLDETCYPVDSAPDKTEQTTSTPKKDEDRRLSSRVADCSAISNLSYLSTVNETTASMNATALKAHETKQDLTVDDRTSEVLRKGVESLKQLDVNTVSDEVFLDGCKIYLTGIAGNEFEKLRKLINSGGGTRFNQLNESVSHVVVGDKIQKDMRILHEMRVRPNIVSISWVVECCQQGQRVPEDIFTLPEFVPEDQASTSHQKRPAAKLRKSRNITPSSDADIDNMLDQYLPKTGDDTGDITVMNADKDKTTEGNNEEATNDETQMDAIALPDRVFDGRKFTVVGFSSEEESNLNTAIMDAGGKIVLSGSRAIPDYAVVPMTGCEVNQTVGDVVTHCWVGMCLDADTFLDTKQNPFFSPITVVRDVTPLKDCVLSVSQYTGVERECIILIAEQLGAVCQEIFLKKAKAIRNLLGNTHLILQRPEGPKYEAAKKWEIPAVTKEWLLECASSGKRQPENNFFVEYDKGEKVEAVTEGEADAVVSTNHRSNTSPSEVEGKSEISNNEVIQARSKSESEAKQLPLNAENALEQHDEDVVEKEIKQPPLVKDKTPFRTPKPRTPATTSRRLTDKENGSRSNTIERKTIDIPEDTPSKFLTKGVQYIPRFSPSGLNTPASERKRKNHRRKSSLPLDEYLYMNLKQAVKNTGGWFDDSRLEAGEEEANDQAFEVPQVEIINQDKTEQKKQPQETCRCLVGVTVYVSKKLQSKQAEYHSIVTYLAGDVRWSYDEDCTHFVFQGKANDNTKEFRKARDDGKYIVSPEWLVACQHEEKRVDESLYPHTYNPKMNLSVLSQTVDPPRSSRHTRSSIIIAPPPPMEMAVDGFNDITDDMGTEEEMRLIAEVEAVEQKMASEENGSEGSLEQREDFQRHFEEIMSTTTNQKGLGKKRRSRRPGNLSTSNNSNLAGENQRTRRLTRSIRKSSIADAGNDSARSSDIKVPELISEASQSIQITWDDPASRKMKESIMARLQREDSQIDGGARKEDEAQAAIKELTSEGDIPEETKEDSPTTPRAPPMRLPTVRPAVAPQPDFMHDQPQEEMKQLPRKFLFTGMSNQEKIAYAGLIEQLGGEVMDKVYFDATCSHVVVENPTRNEKYLAALASGKWILHKSYLEACREAGGFCQEDLHEWGSAVQSTGLSETEIKLALAASRWRKRIQESDSQNCIGSFHGWRVLLIVDKHREASFRRILEVGGAKVIATRPPFNNLKEASHAFLDLKKAKISAESLDLPAMVSAGILCLKPEYIADFLIQDPSPDPSNFLIPQVRALVESLGEEDEVAGASTPSKRKGRSGMGTPLTKRTRHK